MVYKIICILTLAGFVSCSPVRKAMHPANPVVAHRGAWKKTGLPENSIASLKQAITLGCGGSEFDVRMTIDDSLVINHDPAFKGMPIDKSTYTQLTAVKLTNGETMPTLRQYLEAGLQNNKSTQLVIEIKPSDISKDRGREMAAKTVAVVQMLKAEKRVTYISFDIDILRKIESIDAKAITQLLDGSKNPAELKAEKIDGADYHISVFKMHPEWIAMAKQNKIILNVWTVNEDADMDWCIENKFDFITTNEPERLRERLKQ